MMKLFISLHGRTKRLRWNESDGPMLQYAVLIGFLIVFLVASGLTLGEWLADSWTGLYGTLGIGNS